MNKFITTLSLVVTISGFSIGNAETAVTPMIRDYNIVLDKPAANWREANPLGNGRLGAMVHGGIKEETIGLNDDTLWTSEPLAHLDGTKHRESLQGVRDLIYANKHNEATATGQKTMTGRYGGSMLPLGNLKLSMPSIDEAKATNYHRALNLNNAKSVTKFTHNGVDYIRSVIVSHPDQALVLQLTASKEKSIDLNVTLDSLIKHELETTGKKWLWMTGKVPHYVDPHYLGKRVIYDEKKGMRFASLIQVDQTDGTSTAKNGIISVKGASSVTIKLAAATSYNGYDKNPTTEGKDEKKAALSTLEIIKEDSFETLNKRHLADYQPLFSRVDLQLGDTDLQGKPVSNRSRANFKGNDPDLDELKASIRAVGLSNPIRVERRDDGGILRDRRCAVQSCRQDRLRSIATKSDHQRCKLAVGMVLGCTGWHQAKRRRENIRRVGDFQSLHRNGC